MARQVPRWPGKTYSRLAPYWKFTALTRDVMHRYIDGADDVARAYLDDAGGAEDREYRAEEIRWLADDLRAAAGALDAITADVRRDRVIAALENTTGRTPQEAAAFRAKAAELRGGRVSDEPIGGAA